MKQKPSETLHHIENTGWDLQESRFNIMPSNLNHFELKAILKRRNTLAKEEFIKMLLSPSLIEI